MLRMDGGNLDTLSLPDVASLETWLGPHLRGDDVFGGVSGVYSARDTVAATTALIATHNLELARRMDRVLRLENGMLVEVAPASVR